MSESVNAAYSKTSFDKKQSCFRCGRFDHLANSFQCPARNLNCDRCGLKGHFQKFCKTKNIKKRPEHFFNKSEQDKKNKKKTLSEP